jgi:NTP pyrophosphatase (non-canonical NTP hydrolase)
VSLIFTGQAHPSLTQTYGEGSMPSANLEARVMDGIAAAMDLAHATATNAGWYRDPATGRAVERNFGEVIALMHSELSEALEAHRKGLMDDKLPGRSGIEVELADCLIRIFDTARALNLDLPGAVIEKNRFNATRADHSLAARAAGGKKY